MKRLLCIAFCLLLMLSPGVLLAQQRTITGSVYNETGESIPGVTITVKGGTLKVSSNTDGKFVIGLASGPQVLVFQYLGMETKELNIAPDDQNIRVTLQSTSRSLDQVVVVGYGTTKKSDLTGAVSTLKGSEINKTPSSSVDQLLQGKIPGVQVIAPGGQPGAGATIRIRGASSLNGSKDPLMVVDGYPWGDAGQLKQINPEDIESIEVLKDASSAAIYGSRGANGVIIVTTKKGTPGKPRISFSTLNTISTMAVKADLWRDGVDQAIYENEAALTGGTPPGELPYLGQIRSGVYFPSIAELRGLDPAKPQWPHNTDWQKLVYRNPFSQSYTLSADGGSEHTRYAVSGNYYKEQGLAIKNDYDKYTSKLSLDQKLTNAVTIGANVVLAHTQNNGIGLSIDRSPIFPAYDANGNYFKTSNTDYGNPLALANQLLNKTKTFDMLGTIFANVKIADWLQFRTQLNSKFGNSVNDQYDPSGATQRGFESQGFGSIGNGNYSELLNENYFTVNKTFSTIHKLNFVAGYSIQKTVNRSSTLVGRQFVNDNLQNEDLSTATSKSISNGLSRYDLSSFYGRANYTLLDRYLFTVTGRADGSTKFGSNNKWAYFPSAAVAWKLNQEDFIKSLNIFSELKLRGSYGFTGNQGISPYQTLDRFGSARYFTGTGFQTGFGPGLAGQNNEQGLTVVGGLGNNSLKWETTRSVDFGLDVGILDQRFTLTADYYVKRTKDLLRLKTIAPSAGYDQQWINDGAVNNKGVELGLNGIIIQKEDLNWSVGVIFTKNKNEVVSMGESNKVEVGTLYEMVRQRVSTFTVGQPMYAYYGYQANGIIQTLQEGIDAGLTGAEAQPGEIKYVDLNKDGVIDGNDRSIIGNPNPDFTYAFNTNLKFKEFDLTAQIYGVQGIDVFDFRKMTPSRQILRWTPDNPSQELPRANRSRGYRASDFFITDGSFLRIQNVTLGYTFKENLIKGVKNLRVYFSGNNLYTFTKFNTGFDPEVGESGINEGSYPKTRAFSLGLNVGF